MDEFEKCKLRVQKAFEALQQAKWSMKTADKNRFKFPFDSEERKTAEYLYEESKREYADALAYFRHVSKQVDDARMHRPVMR